MTKLSHKEENKVVFLLNKALNMASALNMVGKDDIVNGIKETIESVEKNKLITAYATLDIIKRNMLSYPRSENKSAIESELTAVMDIIRSTENKEVKYNKLKPLITGGRLTFVNTKDVKLGFELVYNMLGVNDAVCASTVEGIHEANVTIGKKGKIKLSKLMTEIASLIEKNEGDDVFIITTKKLKLGKEDVYYELKDKALREDINIIIILEDDLNTDKIDSADMVLDIKTSKKSIDTHQVKVVKDRHGKLTKFSVTDSLVRNFHAL